MNRGKAVVEAAEDEERGRRSDVERLAVVALGGVLDLWLRFLMNGVIDPARHRNTRGHVLRPVFGRALTASTDSMGGSLPPPSDGALMEIDRFDRGRDTGNIC